MSKIPNKKMEKKKARKRIKSFEKNWNVKIYHVISIAREMRDTVHVLYVSKDKSKWKTEKEDLI